MFILHNFLDVKYMMYIYCLFIEIVNSVLYIYIFIFYLLIFFTFFGVHVKTDFVFLAYKEFRN